MAKRKVRNKARDMVGDYYKSNRQAEEENEKVLKEKKKAEEKEGKKSRWSRSELAMLLAIIIGAIGILFKYVILK